MTVATPFIQQKLDEILQIYVERASELALHFMPLTSIDLNIEHELSVRIQTMIAELEIVPETKIRAMPTIQQKILSYADNSRIVRQSVNS